jgi:hypothetical protein
LLDVERHLDTFLNVAGIRAGLAALATLAS